MDMNEAPIKSSDPQAAIAIAEQACARELPHRSWERIHLGLPINETLESLSHADQQYSVNVFCKTPIARHHTRERKEFRRPRFPSPQSVRHLCPKIAFFVLIQTEYSPAKSAILAVTLNAATLDRAEFPARGYRNRADPNRPLTILQEGENRFTRK